MTLARFVPLAVLLLALSGCPFSTDTPLADPASARPDSRLVGSWRTQDKESGEWNTLTILPFDEHEMVGIAPDGTSGKIEAFRLFTTGIGMESFLNLRQLDGEQSGGGSEGWYFARYQIVDDRLLLSIVDDGLFENRHFASSAELQEFFRQHLSDPLLYASDADQPTETLWERVPEPAGASKSKS